MGPLYNTMRTELVGAGGESPSVGEITKGVHGNPTRGVLDHVKAESGWREGDTFLFGFGALLATSVFTRRFGSNLIVQYPHLEQARQVKGLSGRGVEKWDRIVIGYWHGITHFNEENTRANSASVSRRGVYPSANGRRKFVRCTAPGYLLTFRHKGGFATLDQWSPDDECTVTAEVHLSLPPPRDAHGVMLPLSREELSSIAATEGGYALKNIKVVPYGCEDAIDSLAFITSPWRRLREPVLPTPRYINLILEGANEKQLDPT